MENPFKKLHPLETVGIFGVGINTIFKLFAIKAGIEYSIPMYFTVWVVLWIVGYFVRMKSQKNDKISA